MSQKKTVMTLALENYTCLPVFIDAVSMWWLLTSMLYSLKFLNAFSLCQFLEKIKVLFQAIKRESVTWRQQSHTDVCCSRTKHEMHVWKENV